MHTSLCGHAILLPLGLALGAPFEAQAATITVTNTNDSGAGSLRAAIASAAASGGIGGGLDNTGTATITRCTFSGNSATGRTTSATMGGGAINNSAGMNGFSSTSGDLVGGTGGAIINPLLDPLADNGGPTRTHALQTGSPAIDVGSPGFGVVTDQRGFPRFTDTPAVAGLVGGNASDIGAFESGNSALRITSITRPAVGSIVLQGIGLPSAMHTVQASLVPDGASFVAIAPIFSDASGNLGYHDDAATSLVKRFYRFTFQSGSRPRSSGVERSVFWNQCIPATRFACGVWMSN